MLKSIVLLPLLRLWQKWTGSDMKAKCLVCNKNTPKDTSAVVRYRYEEEKVGTAYLCKTCADKFDVVNEEHGEPI